MTAAFVCRIDSLGRLVIPMEYRRDWEERQPVEVLATEEGLLIRPYRRPGCVGCGAVEGIRQVAPGIAVCRHCAGRILESFERTP
jgi:bifunctional DNA-binding transcriptional regulator/antitoxin component of YhaV-PrlF toxin-antitoxin module